MLTFEYEKADEALHIHANPENLRWLAASLQQLADDVEQERNDHIHLMTEAWGGHELTEVAQSKTSIVLNHVKVFGWHS